MIGAVGEQTRGVEKLLRRIGFRYAERVDPFDGGPHFVAPTDDVSLVRTARRVELVAEGPTFLTERVLVARRSRRRRTLWPSPRWPAPETPGPCPSLRTCSPGSTLPVQARAGRSQSFPGRDQIFSHPALTAGAPLLPIGSRCDAGPREERAL